MSRVSPYRGPYGASRPARLEGLGLPPGRVAPRIGLRPLKRWRYVAVFAEELMLCAAGVRIGPGRQEFWAVWDRHRDRLVERTALRSGAVGLAPGRLELHGPTVAAALRLEEQPGVEAVCPHGRNWVWTRKQAGVLAVGTVEIDGVVRRLDARAVIDDTVGYHARHTSWRWTAGVGSAQDGRDVAWNLVAGVNDPPESSERTVRVAGEAREAAPVDFGGGLAHVTSPDGCDLRFAPGAARARTDELLVFRSSYEAPFGTFSGALPGGVVLAEGLGVMERHEAAW